MCHRAARTNRGDWAGVVHGSHTSVSAGVQSGAGKEVGRPQPRCYAGSMRSGLGIVGILLGAALLVHCGDESNATIEQCEPEGACSCSPGTERPVRCSCVGGSACTVSGGGIEFSCDGNADCDLTCGENCLVECPGTTSCMVTAGNATEVRCPGTASCDITCEASCAVEIRGAADGVVRCEAESSGAVCAITGCTPEECGDGVYACGTACPASE